jgi:hypothetical protein
VSLNKTHNLQVAIASCIIMLIFLILGNNQLIVNTNAQIATPCWSSTFNEIDTEINVPAKSRGHDVFNSGTIYDDEIRFTSFQCFIPSPMTPSASFQCSINGDPWINCPSPFRHISDDGGNVLQVRTIATNGQVDNTPAVFKWKYNNICITDPDKCPPGW